MKSAGKHVIGVDAADLGGREDDGVGLALRDPSFRGDLIAQIDEKRSAFKTSSPRCSRTRTTAEPTMPL